MGIIPFLQSTAEPQITFIVAVNELSESRQSFEAIRNTIGFETVFYPATNSLGNETFLVAINSLTESVQRFEAIINSLGNEVFFHATNSLGNETFIKAVNTIGFREHFIHSLNALGNELFLPVRNALAMSSWITAVNELSQSEMMFIVARNDISDTNESTLTFQSIVNQLARHDPTVITAVNELSQSEMMFIAARNDISATNESTVTFVAAVNQLARHDPTVITAVNELSQSEMMFIAARNDISATNESTVTFVAAVNQLARHDPTVITAVNELSSGQQVFITSVNELSEPPEQMFLPILNDLEEKDRVISIITAVNELSEYNELPSVYQSMDHTVLFDGIDITTMLDEWSFTNDRGSLHNQFSASSMNRELFLMMDPEVKKNEARIEVRVGTRSILFCFETKAGDQVRFNIWGRSKSALDDDIPDETKQLFHTSVPVSAKEMAESTLTVNNLVWELPDWNLPAYYEYEGTPLGCVLDIASAAKAVARCADNGDIVVSRKLAERPVRLHSAESSVSYDTTGILSDGYSIEYGTGFDAILVEGWSPEIALPELEVEESSPVRGTTVHIRAYRGHVEKAGKPEIIETFVTAGILTYEGIRSEEKEEIVTFNTMTGSVGKPISYVTGVEWKGHNCGSVSFEIGQKELRVSGSLGEHGIARVNYVTEYEVYRLDRHNIDMILAVWTLWGPNVSVMVRMNGGTNEAPAVSDNRLTGVPIAVERGTAELDDMRYDKIVVDADVPYNDDAIDGNIAWFDHEDILAVGKFYIQSVTTTCNGPQIKQKVRLEKPRLVLQ